ncbi:hypothetical protein [Streptomyces griseus]|uniref:hypothetical protein n=1 Tax=Streptomyces griseus TaxID=1911 RepID=UPI00380FAA68
MDRFVAPANPVPPAASPAETRRRKVTVPLDTHHVPFIAVSAGGGGLDIPRLTAGADGWIQYVTPGPCDRYPDTDVLLARTVCAVSSGPPDGTVLWVAEADPTHIRQLASRACRGDGASARTSGDRDAVSGRPK